MTRTKQPAQSEMDLASRSLATADAVADNVDLAPADRSLTGPPAANQDKAGVSRSRLIDRAYDQYCKRYEAGERPDIEAYCGRFRRFKTSLKGLIQAHDYLESHPEYVEGRQRPGTIADFVRKVAAELPDDGKIPWPSEGQTFLGFKLLQELGRGAFARVFLATEPALGNREVAVKISEGGAAEARILGRLSHPNIVPVHSVQEDRATGLSLVCMPYLGCATLCDVLDRGFESGSAPTDAGVILQAVKDFALPNELPPHPEKMPGPWRCATYADGILDIAVQLAEALAFAHGVGIRHLDLKPSNILISSSGRAMLLDFNLSHDVQILKQRLGGTLPYMSPEQLREARKDEAGDARLLDGRSDVFSLGVILFEMLSGEHPFGTASSQLSPVELCDLLLDRQRQRTTTLRQLCPQVDRQLAALVERCLAYEAAGRPQSAAELTLGLKKCRSPFNRMRRWVGRNTRTVACAGAVLALLSAAGAYAIAQREPAGLRLLRQAQEARQAGDYSGAIDAVTRALETDPSLRARPDIFYTRGIAHHRLGARKAASLSARTDQDQQLNLERQQQFSAAWADYDEALHLGPRTDFEGKTGELYACIGYCSNQAGQDATATHYYEQAVKAGLRTPEVLNNLGFGYYIMKRLPDADASFSEAIRLNPNLQAPYRNRAKIGLIRTQKQAADAVKLLNKAQPSQFPEILRLLIMQPNNAAADFERAIELGSPSAQLHYEAAHLYALVGSRNSRHIKLVTDRVARLLNPGRSLKNCSVFATLLKRSCDHLIAMAEDRQANQRALHHLRQACNLGLDLRALKTNPDFNDLRSHPAFQALLESKPSVQAAHQETRLLDPLGKQID